MPASRSACTVSTRVRNEVFLAILHHGGGITICAALSVLDSSREMPLKDESISITAVCWWSMANRKGVYPFISALMMALLATSSKTISIVPMSAATITGVAPLA